MSTVENKRIASGFSVPVYGMGTWQMGGRFEHDAGNDDAADIAAIHRAYELGVRHFDTAEVYAAGHSETLLGKAIEEMDRADLLLVSKVHVDNQRPDDLLRSFEATRERMGVDYLDLYMLHRFNSSIPIDETMDALCGLVDSGHLRHPAVSNFTVERMRAAQTVSRHKIVANQLHYNVQVREVEHVGLLEHCQEHDVMLIAWGPLQKGGLDLDAPVLVQLSEKYVCTPTQVAINWLVSQPNVVTLSKTRSLRHLQENIDATSWTMEPEDIERIRIEMPGQLTQSDRVPLDYT